MPSWLKRAPSFAPPAPASQTVDWTSLTAGLELPSWLDELSDRVEATPQRVQPGTLDAPETRLIDPTPPAVTAVPASAANDAVLEGTSRPAEITDLPAASAPPARLPIEPPKLDHDPADNDEPTVDPPYYALALLVILVGASLALIALLVALR